PLALGMGWGMVPDLLLYWPQWTRESVAAQRLIEPVNTPHTNNCGSDCHGYFYVKSASDAGTAWADSYLFNSA
ncbi:MAG: hypothetical protein ABIQ90_13250, partial [Polaromonas sp.]